MVKKTKYFVLEGNEGVGKTTHTNNLVKFLKEKGYKVLQTKEPGTPLSPITMQLRTFMLDKKYDNDLTIHAREFISQAIRSIHLDKVIYPAMGVYDFIIQDRGILTGLSYGAACGHDIEFLKILSRQITLRGTNLEDIYKLYDQVIYLKGDISKGLNRALTAKKEFEAGDAMESKGSKFLTEVSTIMDREADLFNTITINIEDRSIEDVFTEILNKLHLQ